MRIENIIDDIKNDIVVLSEQLTVQLTEQYPALVFSVSVPGIDELTTIKSVLLSISENQVQYYLSVHIHTHNGNRVFEDPARQLVNGELAPCEGRHPFQDRFVDLLRDIIKRKKNKTKPGNRPGDLYNDIRQYANTA